MWTPVRFNAVSLQLAVFDRSVVVACPPICAPSSRPLADILDDAGLTTVDIAKRLGVSRETLRRWEYGGERASASSALIPVVVEDAPMFAMPSASGLVLVAPSGHRVEGLDIDTAAELLSRLA